LTKETNKRNDANTMKPSDCAGVVGGDDKMQSWNPTARGMEDKNDDIVVIDDDGSGVNHGSDQAVSCTQPVLPTPHHNSHASSEVCLQPGGMHPSQSDSDVDSIVKPCSSQQEGKELNGTRESDVIVLDSTTDTESEGAEIMGKDLATRENTHLILHEPLVTVKHRNPRTTLEIEAAVDPLSLELPQKEDETSNVTSSLQNTSSNSLCAENPDLDSENINSMVSSTETGLNECGASGVDDDDVGLSGSLLYQCGYVTCAFTAEDSSLLKDHLLVCDLARASSSLTCVHCKKQFKYVSSLIEHLRTHGTRRFRCALCSFRAPAPQQVVKHMKQRHRVGSTRIAPLDPLSTDPETAIFVMFPKVR
jgi:DNA-directed RNA polymerase subunit RPC12/RpoP